MTTIDVMIGSRAISLPVARRAPLGWRFWTLAGFPADPVDPRRYGGSRCLPLGLIEIDGDQRWLCAMELDQTFGLFCSHDLFPCLRQTGVDAFALAILERHARQPCLF